MSNPLRHLLMRSATIAESFGGQFHRITLEGTALRDAWVPGQKVQIAMNTPFEPRTYTPID